MSEQTIEKLKKMRLPIMAEEYQNQKIASKLFEYMVNECISHNVKSITLEVKETNIKAIHLYEKFDFSKVAVRRKYYQGIDGILMEKELM